jgi:hypothetical protein
MMVDFLGEVITALGYRYHQDTKFLYAHNQEDIEHSCIVIQSKMLSTMRLIVKDDSIYMVARWSR